MQDAGCRMQDGTGMLQLARSRPCRLGRTSNVICTVQYKAYMHTLRHICTYCAAKRYCAGAVGDVPQLQSAPFCALPMQWQLL